MYDSIKAVASPTRLKIKDLCCADNANVFVLFTTTVKVILLSHLMTPHHPQLRAIGFMVPRCPGREQRFALNVPQVVQRCNWFLIEILAVKYLAPIFKCLRVNMRLLTPGSSLNTFSNVLSKPQRVHPSKSNLLPPTDGQFEDQAPLHRTSL